MTNQWNNKLKKNIFMNHDHMLNNYNSFLWWFCCMGPLTTANEFTNKQTNMKINGKFNQQI